MRAARGERLDGVLLSRPTAMNGITDYTTTSPVSAGPSRWQFCPQCGYELDSVWKHCAECGLSIGVIWQQPKVDWAASFGNLSSIVPRDDAIREMREDLRAAQEGAPMGVSYD